MRIEKNDDLVKRSWILGMIERELGCYHLNNAGGKPLFVNLCDIVKLILAAPAEKVIYCKECRHSVQDSPCDPMECMKWSGRSHIAYTTPDGHCHKAELKERRGE